LREEEAFQLLAIQEWSVLDDREGIDRRGQRLVTRGLVCSGKTNVGVKDGCNAMDKLKDVQDSGALSFLRVNCFGG